MSLNKSELIEHMARHADISKATATRALESALQAIKNNLKRGGVVSILNFGKFGVVKRAARIGTNPRTGKQIKIRAKKAVRFTPGQGLRDAVN